MLSGAGPAVALRPQGRPKTGALRPTVSFTRYALRSLVSALCCPCSANRQPLAVVCLPPSVFCVTLYVDRCMLTAFCVPPSGTR